MFSVSRAIQMTTFPVFHTESEILIVNSLVSLFKSKIEGPHWMIIIQLFYKHNKNRAFKFYIVEILLYKTLKTTVFYQF